MFFRDLTVVPFFEFLQLAYRLEPFGGFHELGSITFRGRFPKRDDLRDMTPSMCP